MMVILVQTIVEKQSKVLETIALLIWKILMTLETQKKLLVYTAVLKI